MSNHDDPFAYRGHDVKVRLSDEEFTAVQAEASRTGKPMAVLLREAYFGSPRKPPAVRLLEEALFLRTNGDYAPGDGESWRDWDSRAEVFLRGLLPPEVREKPGPAPGCLGFKWIGQSFATCDGCGKPAWEHEGEMRLRDGAGPFGGEGDWELRPWKPGEAEAIKRKWAPR